MKLVLNSELNLYEQKGKALYSSRQVANEFSKRHDRVLRAIDEIADPKNGVSEEDSTELENELSEKFIKENFFERKYKDESGKWSREVMMTRKGSSVLVMGFTGKKALRFKIKLMDRFDKMESFIESLTMARIEFPAFTHAITNAREEPKHYHFSNEINMIYRIVLGMEAKKFRELQGIEKGESIRPYLTTEQIKAVETLQRIDIGLLVAFPEYETRKSALERYFESQQAKMLKGA